MEANAFLEALYNANYERLYIYAENLLFNAAYAEEAVQETFFEAVRKQDALMRPAAAGGLSSALPHHAGRSNASGGCQGARHLGLEQPETAAAHPQKALQAAFAK